MKIKGFYCFIFLSTILTIYALFSIKNKVAALDYQVQSVLSQIKEENNKIHLLKAERAYLSQPDRIKLLAAAHLKLESIKPSQLISDPLSKKQENHVKFEGIVDSSSAHKKNWTYKTSVNKYIKTVSSRTNTD